MCGLVYGTVNATRKLKARYMQILRKEFLWVLLQLVFLTSIAEAQEYSTALEFGVASEPWLGQRETIGWGNNGIAKLSRAGAYGRINYNFSVSSEADGRGAVLDGSYLSWNFGNWQFGAGAVERNWSPSEFTSLILSKNARPFPSVFLRKTEVSAFRSPLFAWLGPWDAELFIGQLEADTPTPHTKVLGARVEFEPVQGLTIELVRTAQFGGDGRPEDLKALWNILIGNTNTPGDDPANQLAGFGISYRFPVTVAPLRLYVQGIGEDEAGGLPSCFLYLAGATIDTFWQGVPTSVTFEAVDTRIATTAGGFCGPGTAYNGQYAAGYTYYGVGMGADLDTDGRSTRIAVSHHFNDIDISWGATHYVINDTALASHRLSGSRVAGIVSNLGVSFEWQKAQIDAHIIYQGFDLDRAEFGQGLRIALNVSRNF